MKRILKKSALLLPLWAATVVGMVSGDQGFDELNINKTAALSVNPVFILNNATVNSAFTTGSVIYEMGIVQQMVSPNSGVLTGANFNQDSRDNTVQNWAEILPQRDS